MRIVKSSGKIIYFLMLTFLINCNLSTEAKSKSKTEELAASIDEIVSGVNCSLSIQIVSADKYDLIYDYEPQKQMIPASITKLITSALAFHELGVSFNFKTIVYTDDSDIKDGIINGNLYLKGYGDPDLNSGDISELAKLISEKNITEITGNIIYDESFLDGEHYGLANNFKDDTKQNYWPYVSALNFNKNGGGYDPASSAALYLSDEMISK
ncbi:MAG: D-alanyl-D-alanine carboxypeptidase, partial [Ignavibacteria bacterium]|nr:D-alanyl-D-alanine carboxypeptidase [Ignavibacteria bacterium]